EGAIEALLGGFQVPGAATLLPRLVLFLDFGNQRRNGIGCWALRLELADLLFRTVCCAGSGRWGRICGRGNGLASGKKSSGLLGSLARRRRQNRDRDWRDQHIEFPKFHMPL